MASLRTADCPHEWIGGGMIGTHVCIFCGLESSPPEMEGLTFDPRTVQRMVDQVGDALASRGFLTARDPGDEDRSR